MVRHSNPSRLLVAADPVPPLHVYSDDSNFDNNMVIILSALLCALVCVLGLNSIVRCTIRLTRRNALDGHGGSTSRPNLMGMKKETMSQIPVVVYKKGINFSVTECPICLGEFNEGDIVRILPKCSHGFHVMCIDRWLASRPSCPICRQLLFEQAA